MITIKYLKKINNFFVLEKSYLAHEKTRRKAWLCKFYRKDWKRSKLADPDPIQKWYSNIAIRCKSAKSIYFHAGINNLLIIIEAKNFHVLQGA